MYKNIKLKSCYQSALTELLTAVALSTILIVWGILINIPLLQIADPAIVDNILPAPWYVIGLREILLYFDPLLAGILIPLIVILALITIVYADWSSHNKNTNSSTIKRIVMSNIILGFSMWLSLILAGHLMADTLFATSGDAHNMDTAAGLFCIILYFGVGLAIPYLTGRTVYDILGLKKYAAFMSLILLIYAVPLKIFLRLAFNIQYVLVTPWFNV